MSEEIKNGGSAFPAPEKIYKNVCMTSPSSPDAFIVSSSGMSLRDYFAAAALHGFCSNQQSLKENIKDCDAIQAKYGVSKPEMPRQNLAFVCYQIADAMLEARES